MADINFEKAFEAGTNERIAAEQRSARAREEHARLLKETGGGSPRAYSDRCRI